MSNRILDYPEATSITSDDYILLDNEGSGAKCIKASALNVNMDNYTIKEARGAIASFDDGEDLPLAFMGAYITALQDLHGYDYPWVGGSGRNLFHVDSRVDGTIANVRYTSDDEYLYLNGTKQGGGYANLTSLTITLQAGTYYIKALPISGSGSDITVYPYDGSANLTGNVLTEERALTLDSEKTFYFRFAIWTDGTVLNNYKVGIVISKTANIDKFYPYSNICPISGWSAVNVGVSGVNVWDEEWEKGALSNSTGEPYLTSERVRSKNFILTKPTTAYYFYAPNTYSSIRVACYDKDKTYLGQSMGWLSVSNNTSFITPNNTYYIKFVVVKADETYDDDISINYPSTDTEYHAYNGNTYSLTFTDGSNPLTVYGGYVDLVSGVLTVTHGYVDLGTLDWQYSSISERFYAGASDLGVKATDASTPFNAISSALIAKSYNEIEAKTVDYAIGINPNATQFFARYSSITSASDFITAMNGVQLVYELATPLTYQLSKQQIRSLVGENNIFASTGDVIVDYRKLWLKPEM